MGVANALPLLPAASCPSAAGAIASAGLGPICSAASSVASSAASSVAGFGASSVLDALGSWVSGGAVWLLGQIGSVLSATTSIDLGASWFSAHYSTMAALAGVVIVPLLLLGIMQSIYRQSASGLARSVLVNVPLALVLTAVAVQLVQIGLSVTDAMSSAVAQGAGLDSGHFMAGVVTDLAGPSGDPSGAVPAFVLFVGGIAVVLGAVLVWIELLIRSAAVYVAVLFLPLALASLAWPAISHWCRRLVDTLVALVLGKFVIVSVLSLAAGALAGGSSGADGSGGFAAVLGGAALLLLASCAPWALFRLLPFVEAGAVGHLEGLGRRATNQAAMPVKGLARVAMRAAAPSSMSSSMGGMVGAGLLGPSGASADGGTPGGSPGSGAGGGGGSPLAGPSMAETTGVGSTSRPGAGIPMWTPNAAATAAARKIPYSHGYRDFVEQPPLGWPAVESSADHSSAGPSESEPLRPLPRQTGTLLADSIGRDRLGVKLVSRRLDPEEIAALDFPVRPQVALPSPSEPERD